MSILLPLLVSKLVPARWQVLRLHAMRRFLV